VDCIVEPRCGGVGGSCADATAVVRTKAIKPFIGDTPRARAAFFLAACAAAVGKQSAGNAACQCAVGAFPLPALRRSEYFRSRSSRASRRYTDCGTRVSLLKKP
jgi:hypothetical protein